MNRGIFITFEGIEGAGKTTQVRLLAEKFKKEGLKVIQTFEPGDTQVGGKIREILLNPSLSINPNCELLLYFADRIQHIEEKIKPALEAGIIVLCDRFTDSTIAYQGYGRQISIELIKKLNTLILKDFTPDFTIILDLPAHIGLNRNKKINKRDRFEIEDIDFHNRVREGYLDICKNEPERFIVIDATKAAEEVSEEIYKKVKTKFRL
ncbi:MULTISPECIES: dTMP kinase [Thermodesulfovibrio]|jgi:dTMP kinase|uniref:dTMP kinase n=1 Tax=Thermodesulfovibrio TaxID=28261 RepID=UPI00260EB744|nr:dTMP kinase [Thermodesulfovibrio sp.]